MTDTVKARRVDAWEQPGEGDGHFIYDPNGTHALVPWEERERREELYRTLAGLMSMEYEKLLGVAMTHGYKGWKPGWIAANEVRRELYGSSHSDTDIAAENKRLARRALAEIGGEGE